MWFLLFWIADARSGYCIYICIPGCTIPSSLLHSKMSAKYVESSRTTGFMQELNPKSWTYLPISEPIISTKAYKPNTLTCNLAVKVISNKYKYLIFMRELDALLYAQSSFHVKISDWFPSLQTRVQIKEEKKKKYNSDIYFSCLMKLKDCFCSLKWMTELFDLIFLLTKQAQ